MKAKTSIKKALSLIVVLVMLLTMIPVGMISASAAPTIDLGDYENEEEYVIMNVEDWILIATQAQDKDFSGITVKLGADLDFGSYTEIWDAAHAPAEGAYAPQFDGSTPNSGQEIAVGYAATVPSLFDNFAGAFDGQNFTIRNARFEEAAIATKTLDGAEIANVKFENVSVTDFYDYFAYGIVVGEATGSLYIDNVEITDSAVYADSFNTFHFASGAAMVGLASAAEGVEGAVLSITNCKVDADVACGNYKAWGYGYGTGVAVGTVDSNFDLEMSDCTFSGSIESIDWYAGVIGALYVGKGQSATIENIVIDGLSMHSGRGAVTDGVQSWGALAGLVSPYDNAVVTIDKVNVVNTSIVSDAHGLGALLGEIQPINSPAVVGGPIVNNTAGGSNGAGRLYNKETVENVSIEISNIYTDAYVWCNTTTGGGIGAAGLIAQVGHGNNSGEAAGRVMTGEINIYNIYVGGTLLAGKYDAVLDSWTLNQGAGGLFFAVSLAETVINVSNVVVDAQFPVSPQYLAAPENIDELVAAYNYVDNPEDPDNAAKLEAKAAAKTELEAYSSRTTGALRNCISLISAGAHVRQKATGDYTDLGPDGFLTCDLYASDIATTLRGDFNLFTWLNRKGGINYNGEYIGRGDSAVPAHPVVNDTVAQVRPIEAKQMVKFDANGFVDNVSGAIAPATVQVVANGTDKVDMRFIVLAYVDSVESIEAEIVFADPSTGDPVKTFTSAEATLLDGLTAVEGTSIEAYDALDFGAKKFIAVTIKNVPVGTAYEVSWQFSYVTEGGNDVVGDVNYGNLAADGTFVIG